MQIEKFIKFNCPHCAQPIEAPAGVAGTNIDCPSCGKAFKLPRKMSVVKLLAIIFGACAAVAIIVIALLGYGVFSFYKTAAKETVATFPNLNDRSDSNGNPKEPILGALGITLGEPLPSELGEVTPDKNGDGGFGGVVQFSNYPPFTEAIVLALPDRRVYWIQASSLHDEDLNVIQGALEQKYGYGRRGTGLQWWQWANSTVTNRIDLTWKSNWVNVIYRSEGLQDIMATASDHQQEEQAKSLAHGL